MKTFDEYIQGRILKIRNNIPHAFTKYSSFSQLTFQFSGKVNGIMTASEIAEEIINWGGIGKQRAKDYAHYIVAYIAEQENKKQDTLLREQIDRHSHLTDEDADELMRLMGEYTDALITYQQGNLAGSGQKYSMLTDKIIQFINSLKGEQWIKS
jgi:hypothetical protein